jgi:hypothetical protein
MAKLRLKTAKITDALDTAYNLVSDAGCGFTWYRRRGLVQLDAAKQEEFLHRALREANKAIALLEEETDRIAEQDGR